MAFTSNLAAINAANRALKAAGFDAAAPILKAARAEHFRIEKHDGEWHALLIKPLPDQAAQAESIALNAAASEAAPEPAAIAPSDDALAPASEAAAQPATSNLNSPQAIAAAAAFFASRQPAQAAAAQAQVQAQAQASSEEGEAPMSEDEEKQFEADRLARAQAQAQGDAIANAQQATSEGKNGKIWIHASSCQSPVKRVWAIADAMVKAARDAGLPPPSRSEVQDECVRQGVASGTARTQYQAWKKANDNDAANAARAQELSAALNSRLRRD